MACDVIQAEFEGVRVTLLPSVCLNHKYNNKLFLQTWPLEFISELETVHAHSL